MSETIKVIIFDQTYSLRSASGDEHVRRMAQIVDERMHQISEHTTTFDLARIAVLAALNIADELETLRTQSERDTQTQLAPPSDNSGEAVEASVSNTDEKKADEQPSWFEAIFDAEMPVRNNNERLSSQVSAKLKKTLRHDDTKPLNIVNGEND